MSEDASASEVARLAAGAIRAAALTGVGAVHGLVGDSLHRAAPIVTTRMELRAAGRRVRATRSGLAVPGREVGDTGPGGEWEEPPRLGGDV